MKTWGSRIKWVGAAIALSAILLCCALFSFLFLNDEKQVSADIQTETETETSADENEELGEEVESITYAPRAGEIITSYEIGTGTNAQKAAIWQQAITMSVDNRVQVTVKMMANWTATGGSFGATTGTGFTATGALKIPADADIILDLNGCTIDRALTVALMGSLADINVINLADCNFTLNDGSAGGAGKITGLNNPSQSSKHGGGLMMLRTVFTMNGGHLSGLKCYTGAGFYCNSCTIYLKGGSIEGNSAAFGGGFYSVGNTNIYMYDGFSFTNNTATCSGGVCEIANGTTFNIYGGTFTGNNADEFGGAICGSAGVITMTGGTMTNNTCNINKGVTKRMGYGGAIWLNSGCRFSLSGGEIYDNYRINETSGAKEKQSVYFTAGSKIIITGQLTNTKKIGVALADTYTGGFTSGYSTFNGLAPSNYFYGEKGNKQVILQDGEAVIGTATEPTASVTLTWQYSTDGGVTWTNFPAATVKQSIVYDGKTYVFKVLNGSTQIGASIGKYTDLDGNVSNILKIKNAGTYVYMVNNAAGTYKNPTFEFTITQKPVTITWDTATTKTYTGSAQRITATMGNVLTDDANLLAFVYDNGLASTAVNVGSYNTTISGLTGSSARNYKLPTGGTSKTFTIVPAKLTKPVGTNGLIYNGSAQNLLIGVDTNTMTVTGATTGTNATTYNVTVKLKDKTNYVWADTNTNADAPISITIAPKTLVPGGITLKEKEYDGTTTIAAGSLQGTYTLTGFETTADEHNISLVVDDSASVYSSKDVGYRTASVKISLTGTGASNYALLSDTYTFGGYITKSTLKVDNVTATDKVYDGSVSVTLSVDPADVTRIITGAGTTTGYVTGDDVTILAYGAFVNANAGTGKTINISTYVLSGANKDNYIIDFANSATTATADISKKDIDVTFTTTDCVYGYVPDIAYTVADTAGDPVNDNIVMTLSYLNSVDSTTVLKTVGTYTITAVLRSDYAVNYNVTSTSTATVEITKATLTIRVYDAEVDYGGGKVNNGAFVTGLVWSDSRASLGIEDSDLTFTYGDFDTDGGAEGTYVLSIDTTGITLANYNLTVIDGLLSVGLKSVIVTLNITNGVYGGTGSNAAAVTASATLGNGAVVTPTINLTYNGTAFDGTVYTNSATIPVKAGEYTVTAVVDTTSGYTGRKTAFLKIDRAALTVAASDLSVTSKVYDGTKSATIVVNSFTGKVGTDSITLKATGLYADAAVGTAKTVNITAYSLDTASMNNYFIDNANCVKQITGDITKKDVTAVVTAGTCVYGTVPTVTYAVTGAVAGDDIKLTLSYLNGTDSTTVLKTAGKYAITAVLATDFADNYNLVSVAPNGGAVGDPVEVEITKAPLTITVYNAEVAYGVGTANNGAFVTGLVWSDTRASLSIEDSDLTFTYGDFDTDSGAVGTYVLSIDPVVLANYTVSVVDGTLSVGLKTLTVEITVTNGVYGGTGSDEAAVTAVASDGSTPVTVTINYTYNGTSYDGTVYTNSTAIPVKPGEYEVIAVVDTASGYSGRATSLLKISRAALTVTVTATTAGTTDKAEYGTAISNGNLKTRYKIVYSGWVNGDDEDPLSHDPMTGDIEPTDAVWTTDYFQYAPVGTYKVVVSGLTSDNYEITYVDGTLTVEKANATVTINNQSSVYNGLVPAAKNVTGTNYTVTGLKRTADDLGVSITIVSAAKDVASYDLEVSANNANYNVTFKGQTSANTATDNSGVWTITGAYKVTKAKLTITADNKEITYGDAAPAYTAIYEGFIGAEGTATGPAAGIFTTELVLGCAYVQLDANDGKVGTYDIIEDTAAVADNYDITFVAGKLTVNKKAITVTIDRTKTVTQYGKTPIAFTTANVSNYYTFDVADLAQSTDDLQITLTHSVTTASNVGSYPITAVSGNANYKVTFTDNVYTVEQYKITVEWVVVNDDSTETTIAAGDVPKFEYNGAVQGPKAYFNMPSGKVAASVISGLQKNVGTGYIATVVISAANKLNFTFDASTSNSQAFEITARELSITWSADLQDGDGVFYFEFNEGIEQHPTATFGNVVAGETVTPVYVDATGLVCSSHDVEVRITDKNYKLPTNTKCKYYIVQMSLNSFYWTSDGTTNINASTYTYTYDGETHMPTAMAGVSVSFSYVITYSDGSNCGNRAVNAGEYTVTAVPADSNYAIPAGKSNKFTFKIAPKEVKSTDVYFDTLTFEYTGKEQQPIFWYVDVNGARIYLDVTVDDEHKVADTYTAEISAPTDKNYAFTGNATKYTKQYTIAPKDIEVEWTLNNGVWVTDFEDDYSGSSISYSANAKMTATYAGEYNDIGLKFEIVRKNPVTGVSAVWTGDIRDAGEYTLRAYVSDKNLADNYNVKEYTRKIVIDRLPLQISVNGGNDYTVYYNEAAPAYTAEFNGFVPAYTDASGNTVDESVTVKAQVEAIENWIFSQYTRGSQPGSYDVTLTTDSGKLKALRDILRNYVWESTFQGVKIIVNTTTGSVLVLAENGTNEFVYNGEARLPEAYYTPTTGNGQQRKLEVTLLAVNPDGTPNEYLTDGEAVNEGTYYISVNRVSGDSDATELITEGLYFKIIKRTIIIKISDREEDYGEVTQTNRGSHIVTEYLSGYGGRNGYLPLAEDEAGLAITVDCNFLKTNGTGNYDAQGYAQVGEYLIEGSWNSAVYGANYEVIFVGSENGVNGQFSAGLFTINKAKITVISNGDAYFEEYGDYNSGDPNYVIKLDKKTDGVYDNIIYSGNKRAGNTDANVTIKYVAQQRLSEAVEPKFDAEYNLTAAPRIRAAGDWIIYYSIEVAGGNHNKYYGAWRVQIRPEEEVIIVIFEKEFTVPYGDGVPEDLTEQLFAGGYYRLANNVVPIDWFRDNATATVAGVTVNSEVGLYNIFFTINEDAVTGSLEYAVKYTDSNYTPETNIGKYRIEQRLLTVNWSEEEEFMHDGTAHMPELSITGWIDGGTLTPDGILANGERKYIYKDGGKEIIVTVTADGDFTEIGGHALKVAVGNSNYRFEVTNAAKAISIKADTVVEYGHLPKWAWYAIGASAAVLTLVILILAVKLKHRKPIGEGGGDMEGFYDDMLTEEAE